MQAGVGTDVLRRDCGRCWRGGWGWGGWFWGGGLLWRSWARRAVMRGVLLLWSLSCVWCGAQSFTSGLSERVRP